MKTIPSHRAGGNPNRARACRLLAALAFLLLGRALPAASLVVPNFSFETPTAPGEPFDAGPSMDYWQKSAKPDYYTTNISTFPWEDNAGIFTNDPLDGAFIDNCDGVQAAFLVSLPDVAIFQDYNSFSDTQTGPSHAFNAVFSPGRSYTLTAGIIGDSPEGLQPGATLQMSLYYRDASNNMVTVAATTITNTTANFPNNTHFVDFTVQTPVVQVTDAWANQNIGVQFLCTVDLGGAGGDWDVDNVRLVESSNIVVPNFSFETPTAPGEPFDAGPFMDYWQKSAKPDYYTTNISTFPWEDNAGIFTNDPLDGAFIDNCDGVQAAFLVSLPDVAIFQDYNSFSDTQTAPTHAFNTRFTPGRTYTMTAGIIGDSPEGLQPGATLQMSFYYRDASNNMVIVASTTVTNFTNIFPNNTHFVDFTVQTPVIQPGDPWAGKNIGIQFLCTVDLGGAGGDWDVDNVRLVETQAAAELTNPVLVNGQGNFGLQGPAGLAYAILAATNITTPATNWTTIATVTNTSGALWLIDPATNLNQRFYRARKL